MVHDLGLREPVMVFDGACGLCHRGVRFVVRRDGAARVTFVPAQSPLGAELQRRANIDVVGDDTVLVFDDGRVFTEGKAVARLGRVLSGWWRIAGITDGIPAPILNVAYRAVARNRYRWFGTADACVLPAPRDAARFRTALPPAVSSPT